MAYTLIKVRRGVRHFREFGAGGDGGPPRPACGADAFRVFGGRGALQAGRLTLMNKKLVGPEAEKAAAAAKAEKARRKKAGFKEGKSSVIGAEGFLSVTCRWKCQDEPVELCFCDGAEGSK